MERTTPRGSQKEDGLDDRDMVPLFKALARMQNSQVSARVASAEIGANGNFRQRLLIRATAMEVSPVEDRHLSQLGRFIYCPSDTPCLPIELMRSYGLNV